MKISTKLISGFTLFLLLMAALALNSVRISSRTLQESVGKNSILLVEEMLKRMDRNIYLKIEELQKHSKDLITQKAVSESNRSLPDCPAVVRGPDFSPVVDGGVHYRRDIRRLFRWRDSVWRKPGFIFCRDV